MSTSENRCTFTYISGAAITQYRFVSVSGAGAGGTAVTHADATSVPVGASETDTTDIDGSHVGQAVTVANGGKVKVEAGGAISVGDIVTSDANGQAATAVATDVAVGIALTATSAANEIVEVHMLGAWIAA